MAQNVYDDPEFFEGYAQLACSIEGLDGAPEWPTLRGLVGEVTGDEVVDLGCGYGWFCRWAAEQGAASVLGIDVSERMLARAREHDADQSAITYRRVDLDEVELDVASVDLAYSSLTLHYLTDLDRLIGTVCDALRPRGRFVFSVEHPIRTAPLEPGFTTDDGGQRHWPIDHYLVDGPRTLDWITAGVVKQHRRISTYLTVLLDHGFTLDAVVEWCPSDDDLAGHPDWADELHRPSFLIVAATRAGASVDRGGDGDGRPLTLYKRWNLRADVTPDNVREFVRERIDPAYRRLSNDVELGLEVEIDGRSIIAVQRWANSRCHQEATTGAAYDRWWAEYEPSLTDWDRLVEFDSEWSTVDVDVRENS